MPVSPVRSQAPAASAPPRSAGIQQRPNHQRSNQFLLRRLGGSRAAAARLHWRNALVSQNLGLVHMVANRESLRSGRPFEDLCSAGYEGLIRAVECFDTSRDVALSSFAVPYIQGAMRMDQRERQQPLRSPRRLRELQQRARRLQETRRAAGQAPFSATELAAALGCSRARLAEAEAVQRALAVSSLDLPVCHTDGEEQGGSLLEQISEPSSRDEDDGQLQWLRQQMGGLAPADRELLNARWIDGLTWTGVAERMGRDCRHCRQRAEELRRALQEASSQPEPSRARAAARAV